MRQTEGVLAEDSHKLQNLADHRDIPPVQKTPPSAPLHLNAALAPHAPLHEDILVPDDRVAHAVRRRLGPAQREDEVARDDRALELERQVRRREELLRGADVVHEARERVRLHDAWGLAVLPLREVRPREGRACIA